MPYLFQQPVSAQEIRRKTQPSLGEELLEYLWFFIKVFSVVVLSYVFLRDSLMRNFEVSGLSMAPNYSNSDVVFVNKLVKRFGDIKRGDVIVFREPDNRCPRETTPGSCFLIKRVIALPGESIFTKDGALFIVSSQFPEGVKLDETAYLKDTVKTYADGKGQEVQVSFGTVHQNAYFVLGDNRTNSIDSRFSNVGFITSEQIEGKEFYRSGHGFFNLPKYNISNN